MDSNNNKHDAENVKDTSMKVVDADDYKESDNVLEEPSLSSGGDNNISVEPPSNPNPIPTSNPTIPVKDEPSPTEDDVKDPNDDVSLVPWLTSNWPRIVRCQSVIVRYAIISIGLVLLWTIPIVLYGLIPYHIQFHGNDITDLSTKDQVLYLVIVRLPAGILPIVFPWMIRTCLAWHLHEDEECLRKKRIWNSVTVYLILEDIVLSTLAVYKIGSLLIGRAIGVLNFIFQFMYLHYPTRNNPGARWYINLFCGAAMAIEISFSVIVLDLPGFIESEAFQYSAPFLLSLTAMISRKAAEKSSYSMNNAALVSTASLGFSQIFVRAAHVRSQQDSSRMILLEVFYGCMSLITKTTLYYRHVLINKWTSGKCTLRAGNSERARYITAHSNVNDTVFELCAFSVSWILCQILNPIPTTDFIWIFVVCVTFQLVTSMLSMTITGFMERIDFEKITPGFIENMPEFRYHVFFYGTALVIAYVYMLHVLVRFWGTDARREYIGN